MDAGLNLFGLNKKINHLTHSEELWVRWFNRFSTFIKETELR